MRFHSCFDERFPAVFPYEISKSTLAKAHRELYTRQKLPIFFFLGNIVRSKEFRFCLILISVINKLSEKEEQLARYDRMKKLDFSSSKYTAVSSIKRILNYCVIV